AAIQALNEIPVGTRSVGLANVFYTDQENYPTATVACLKPRAPSSPRNRIPKQPLADQDMAFQAALQQSNDLSSSTRGRAAMTSGQNEGVAIKGAAAAAGLQRLPSQEGQRKKSAKKKPERTW
ncbi:MAG: hypothetical protein Q9224_004951, partial [Gallowayella concinna]